MGGYYNILLVAVSMQLILKDHESNNSSLILRDQVLCGQLRHNTVKKPIPPLLAARREICPYLAAALRLLNLH